MQDIQTVFARYSEAVFQKDTAAFLSLFDENVRVFDMWAWTYDGLPAWREMVTGWFANLGADRDVVMFDDLRIQQSGDMAVASAIARFAAVSEKGEELRFLQNRLTWVIQKKDGAWKIIHEHTSGPVDGSTMKVQLQR